MKLTSIRPYLLRAFYDWILNNGLTPHLLVDATRTGVVVPVQHVKDGKIVLNIAPTAVREIKIDNAYVEFSARFGGTAYDINLPILAVEAIYARENGKGMVFPPESGDGDEPDDPKAPVTGPVPRRPVLKVVK